MAKIRVANNNQALSMTLNPLDDLMYYKPGGTFSTAAYIELAGHSAASAKRIIVGIVLPKSIARISNISVTRLTGSFFGDGGLVNSAADNNWVTTTGITISATKASDNAVRIYVDNTAAFTNTTTFTPVSYFGHVTFTFS